MLPFPKMAIGIERVVNWSALARTRGHVCLNDRITAPISEDQVVFRDETVKGVGGIPANSFKRRRCVDIQKSHRRAGSAQIEDRSFQQFVKHSDTARLDD